MRSNGTELFVLFLQILLCVIMLIIIARLSTARPSIRTKLRGSSKPLRRYKITTRGNCDQRAPPTHTRLAHLWSKLRFHLAVLFNGTLHGVNNTYCKQTNRCKYRNSLRSEQSCALNNHSVGVWISILPFVSCSNPGAINPNLVCKTTLPASVK